MSKQEELLEHLRQAMRSLYIARHMAEGPQGPIDGKWFPKMDCESVNEIASVQDILQRLLSRLESAV